MVKLKLGNKGMAIELVIITTVVVFALCTIMTLYSVYALNYNEFIENKIETKLLVDNIGDRYLTYLNSRGNFDEKSFTYENGKNIITYNIDVVKETDKTILIVKEGRTPSLTVEYKKNAEGNYYISRWSYGD